MRTGRRGWRSLAWRLASTYLGASLLVVVILSITVYVSIALHLDRQRERELEAWADFYAAYVANLAANEGTLAGLAPTVANLFVSQADVNVRLFAASDGRLLAATRDIGPLPSRAALVELNYRSPTLFTRPSRDLPDRQYAARQIVAGGQPVGVVEVSRSRSAGETFLTSLRAVLLGAIALTGVAAVLVSGLLARRLSRPIREVELATRRIAAGDLDVRLGPYPPDEIGRLAESVNQMAARLKRLEDDRLLFIGGVSHDLRTPLTAIKGLLVNVIDEAQPDQRPSLEIAERETERLIRLVNQLLDFARWRGGRLVLDRRPVDVATVARDCVALIGERARHRGVTLMVDLPAALPSISADGDRLERVILNVLDNGIKFTPSGGRVTLTARQREGMVEISVTDTGSGMTEAERQRAFEPYGSGPGGGAGLGLTISRAIVEAHGGRMDVESSPGEGCRAWFTLPA